MIHHNPIRGELSGRHGLANTETALHAFASLGTELILCGHDHLQAIYNVERGVHGLVISTAGTISNRIRPGRASSFNLVTIDERNLRITTYSWQNPDGFVPQTRAPSAGRSRPAHSIEVSGNRYQGWCTGSRSLPRSKPETLTV